jgi:crotonobetainyl-CoA:carnitine CoA-transferase CaiB-like acyl-CoA transferase
MNLSTAALAALWCDAALDEQALDRIALPGADPIVPSSFAVAAILQASLGAAALAAAECGRLRGAPVQRVSVDARDVVREASCRFTLDGRSLSAWDKLSGLYRCADEDGSPRWVRLHANFAHHRDGALRLLGLPPGPDTERATVAEALRHWTAQAFEDAAAEHGLVAAAVRTPAQWRMHPQAAALEGQPLVDIERIGDAAPREWPAFEPDAMPLGGLRVLDLSRILAGPVAGRTLAAYGADVMLVNSPLLPNIDAIAETSRGKLSAHIDLARPEGTQTLRRLVRECDVFLGAYRPGSLDERGFGPVALARLRPGIVCVSLSAYGHLGPWSGRRGFDSLVQSATGLNVAEAQALGSDEPRALPLQALDYGAGFLLAFGALAAMIRQRREGGSWLVRVSLAGVGRWLQSLPRVDERPADELRFDDAMETSDSGWGRLAAVRHAARFSHTPPRWRRTSMPPGTHAPAWPGLAAG